MKPVAKKLTYAQAIKRQFLYVAILLLLLAAIVWRLEPIDTNFKIIVLLFYVGIFTFCALAAIRKATNQVSCSNCNSELYTIIQLGHTNKTPINFCPYCGTQIHT